MAETFLRFPPGFLWGVATSSFQIEGSPLADGACESNWYRWTHTPGRIANGHHADTACDHYRRYAEDLRLMADLGLTAYRFSLSWPRLEPEPGRFNPKGFDFYRRLLDGLQEAGITPLVTLHHWEIPCWLPGGWESRDTPEAFARLASRTFRELGDRVRLWATLNEPSVCAHCAYLWPWFPPGKPDRVAFGRAVHHLNLAHALAVSAFRESGAPGEIGIVLALGTWEPASKRPEDVRHAAKMEYLSNRVFLDPFLGKGYEAAFLDFSEAPPGPWEWDLKRMTDPGDFLGVNHYSPNRAAYDPGANLLDLKGVVPEGVPVNDMGWEIRPEAFREVLLRYGRDTGFRKVIVTENGYCHRESLRSPEELLDDDEREHYLGSYLAESHRAVEEGLPLAGYFVWSLLDNFEWTHGYDPRFGLVHVDFATQKRTVKRSGRWYSRLARENGFDPRLLPQNPAYRRSP